MRKYTLWPTVIAAGVLVALATLAVLNSYGLDVSSPVVSVRLAPPAHD